MSVHVVSEAEAEVWIEALGESFFHSEVSFEEFEKKFLSVYSIVFDELSKVASLKESGRSGEAELSMSKWVEPSRVIGVAVLKKRALQPSLIEAANTALKRAGEKFAVVLDDYPTLVYMYPSGDIVVRAESNDDDLSALGIRRA